VNLTTEDSAGCSYTWASPAFIVQEGSIDIPNVFTPNGDGINDRFLLTNLQSQAAVLTLTDRWGRQMFQTRDLTQGWDGNTPNGTPAAEGEYFYLLRLGAGTQERILKGSFTLLR
jgi:gliding motility-associated-like protein